MNDFCQDRDLLAIEPAVFLDRGRGGQTLAAGSDGSLSGTTFTSATGNFVSGGVRSGMVLCTYSDLPSEGNVYEIISVDSATTLTVSVLRADSDGDSLPPPNDDHESFFVHTCIAQIAGVCETLGEKLREMAEVAGVTSAEFSDSAQLRATACRGTLASVFAARATHAANQDANWVKAEFYRRQFASLQLQLRLVVDADGDGYAEQTRTLGNVLLRRA